MDLYLIPGNYFPGRSRRRAQREQTSNIHTLAKKMQDQFKLLQGLLCGTPSLSRIMFTSLRWGRLQISSSNHRPQTDGNSLLDTGCTAVFCCSTSCRGCCSTPFSTEQHLYEQGDGTTMSLIFKAARLVNALIFMCTTESIISALLHRSNKTSAQLSHEPTLLLSLFLILFGECLFVLCAHCAGGSEIRLELARIQCLAQRHLSRLGDCYCGPRAQLRCPATLTLTVDMNFKESVLH